MRRSKRRSKRQAPSAKNRRQPKKTTGIVGLLTGACVDALEGLRVIDAETRKVVSTTTATRNAVRFLRDSFDGEAPSSDGIATLVSDSPPWSYMRKPDGSRSNPPGGDNTE